ncbi:MAG: hypothetical protein HY720_24185 [Planctomycetes bacterium]|nr:hypothetical protein [Planctomycetota bacterium]
MLYEIAGIFPNEHEIATRAEFLMRWLEIMRLSAANRDWALYRLEVAELSRGFGIDLGPFEPFPDCSLEALPKVGHKANTIRVALASEAEEDLDAIEDALRAVGAESVEIEEQIDPKELTS